jgi:hypothetical protein
VGECERIYIQLILRFLFFAILAFFGVMVHCIEDLVGVVEVFG